MTEDSADVAEKAKRRYFNPIMIRKSVQPRKLGKQLQKWSQMMLRIVVLFTAFFAMMVPSSARAQELTVLTENYPPLSYIEDHEITGSSAEIVKEMLRRMGRSPIIQMVPWARGYDRLQTEPNVALFSTTRTSDREEAFHWVGPIAIARNVLYKARGSQIKVDTMQDAKKVGAIATYTEDAREQMLKSWGFDNIDSSRSPVSNLKKLVSGRVDLWFFDSLSMPHVAKLAGIDPRNIEPALEFEEVGLYIAMSKPTPKAVVEEWQRTLEGMKADGTFRAIAGKWLPDHSIPGAQPNARIEPDLTVPLTIYTEDSPPGNYEKNGRPEGMAVEIVREILRRLGQRTEIEIVPWARGYDMALSQPNVALFSTTRLPQRENLFKWVGPLYTQTWGFYAKKGSGMEIDSIEEAKHVSGIGTYLNDAKELFLKKLGFKNLVSTNRNISNIRHVLDNRIDLWVSSDFNMPYLARKAGVDPDRLELVYPFRTVENYIAFSKGTPDAVVDRWQKTLDRIKADGTYQKLKSDMP